MEMIEKCRETIIANLKKVRLSYHMSQDKFAEVLGVNESTYKKIERNVIPPSVAFLEKVSNYTGLPIDYFFYGGENRLDVTWKMVENICESDQIVIAVRIANKIGKDKLCEIIGKNEGTIV